MSKNQVFKIRFVPHLPSLRVRQLSEIPGLSLRKRVWVWSRGVVRSVYLFVAQTHTTPQLRRLSGFQDPGETRKIPSMFRLIRSDATLTRMLPTFDLSCEENTARESGSCFALAELLKLQEIGLFPDDLVKIYGAQSRRGDTQTY